MVASERHQLNQNPLASSVEAIEKQIIDLIETTKCRGRIITSASNYIENEIALKAKDLDCELHILTSETTELNHHLKSLNSERFVSLASEKDQANTGLQEQINEVRDDIALDYVDIVVVAWNEESMNDTKDSISSLVQKALEKSMTIISVMHRAASEGDLEIKFANPESYNSSTVALSEINHTNLINITRDYFETDRITLPKELENDLRTSWSKSSESLTINLEAENAGIDLEKNPDDLSRCFRETDDQAIKSQGKHEREIKYIHGLACFAVILAVLGAIANSYDIKGPVISVLGIAELVVLLVILYLAKVFHKFFGRFFAPKVMLSKSFHQEWLENRYLAEQIRYWVIIYPVLGFHKKYNNGKPNALISRLHRLFKNQGLPCEFTGSYSPIGKHSILAQRLKQKIEKQIKYHDEKFEQKEKKHKTYERVMGALFLLTLIIVILHVFHFVHGSWTLLITAGFPAIAGAIHAIGSKLELERVARQHKTTKKALVQLSENLDLLFPEYSEIPRDQWSHIQQSETKLSDTVRFIKLRQLASLCAQEMSEENQQWQQLLQSQAVGLPA